MCFYTAATLHACTCVHIRIMLRVYVYVIVLFFCLMTWNAAVWSSNHRSIKYCVFDLEGSSKFMFRVQMHMSAMVRNSNTCMNIAKFACAV